MLRSTLEHLFGRKPFRPVRIMLSSQETFDIKHPEAAYLAKEFMAIVGPPAEATDLEASDMVWIDYSHIVHCQPLPGRDVSF